MSNRATRRAAESIRARVTEKERRLMALPAGVWRRLTRDELDEGLLSSLALSSALHGMTFGAGPLLATCARAWVNNHFSVLARDVTTSWGEVEHLWVRRQDGAPIRDWHAMQRIKNELAVRGASRVAVEVYPPAGDVFDQGNWFHLWVLPEGFALPFGLV